VGDAAMSKFSDDEVETAGKESETNKINVPIFGDIGDGRGINSILTCAQKITDMSFDMVPDNGGLKIDDEK